MSFVLKNIFKLNKINKINYILFNTALLGCILSFTQSVTNIHIKDNKYIKKSLSYLASANLITITTLLMNFKTLRLTEIIFTQPIYLQSYINLIKHNNNNNNEKVDTNIITFLLFSFFGLFCLGFSNYLNLVHITDIQYSFLFMVLYFGILITFIKNFIKKFKLKQILNLLIIMIPTMAFIVIGRFKKFFFVLNIIDILIRNTFFMRLI